MATFKIEASKGIEGWETNFSADDISLAEVAKVVGGIIKDCIDFSDATDIMKAVTLMKIIVNEFEAGVLKTPASK